MPKALVAVLLAALAACSEPQPPAPPPAPPKPVVQAPPATPPAAAVQTKMAATEADANAALASRVKRALEDERKVQAAAIDLTVADGKVTLWGTAASEGERSRAAAVVKAVQGVKAIENNIAVVRGS